MEKTSLSERKFLLTSLDYKIKSIKKEEKKEDINKISITSKSFPKIRYRTLTSEKESSNIFQLNSPKKEKYFLKNLKQFISPINKSNSELKEIKKIKKNLIANKLKESYYYKLKINPNYFKSYGLNDFVTISNKNENKNRNNTYRYNNISSYNNIIKKKEENKNNKIIKSNKKQKELLLKCVPYILKNSKNNNGIFKFFNNTSLIDENSIWRGKDINNLIHNRINIDFFKNFLRNSKSLGKIKLYK